MKKKWINRTLWLVAFAPKADFEIATSGAVLSYIVGTNYHFPKPLLYAFFVFFATLFMYNLMRGASLWREMKQKPNINKMFDIANHYGFAAFSGFVAMVLFVAQLLPFVYYLFFGVLMIISFLYRFRWTKIGALKTALSDLPYVKLFVLATVWTLITVYVPQSFTEINYRLFVGAWLMIFALGIPFDVRDIAKDDPSRKTVAQLLGAVPSLVFSGVLFGSSFLIPGWPQVNSLFAVCCVLIYIVLLVFIGKQPSNHWFYRFVDLSPLIWVLTIVN
jgi:hypothetical protein